jgi:hypothetical protein
MVPGKSRDYKEWLLNPGKSILPTPDNINADDIHSPFFGTANMTNRGRKITNINYIDDDNNLSIHFDF